MRDFFSTLMSGSTTSETLMVTNTICGLWAQDTLGVRVDDIMIWIGSEVRQHYKGEARLKCDDN